jgi:CheY-like chemotaxis protein/two-component sensor histidine kinase
MIKGAQAAAERLARQEHLVTTGTLASGIGHEINNPLTSTLANIEVALEELTSMAKTDGSGRLLEIAAIMEQAREGAERVRQIVRGLRALARQEDVAMPTDVAAAIESSLRVAAHELRHKATVILDLAQTPPVLTGESRLSQVLVNLLINAAQSFLTADILQNRITVSTRVDGAGRVAIAVSDNGPGIPAHLRSRIFDPFFTTKPAGQGTGLGLSVAQSVVASVGGEISVESTLGCGATFRVLLPAVMPLQPSAPGVQPLARGRVLVVDDEAAVLSAIRRVLEKQHDVVLVSDAREALVRLESGERFDVIFCDLMMPWLGGDQLYMKVRAYDLRLAERFVFITGGVTEGRIQRFLAQVPNERLEKPLSIHNVRGIVRRFVDSSASSPALEGLAKPTRASVPPPSQAPAGL